MTNEYVMAEPFYKQEILRNVAIGFTPYMPFTQQYRLEMNSDFAGRGTGYMAYGPNDEGDAGADATGYGWDVRRNVYMGLGEGRLAHMSKYYGSQGRWGIANQVAPQQSAARAAQGAMDFKRILETNVGTKVSEMIGTPVPSRIVDEIGLANLSKLLDAELVSQKKMPEDIFKEEVDRKMQRGVGYSSQGFDLHLDQHQGMAKFLASNLNNFDDTVRSMEVTKARTTTAADKGIMNIKKYANPVKKGKETQELLAHVDRVTHRLNRMVKDFAEKMTPDQQERFKKEYPKTGAFGALRTVIDSTTRVGGALRGDTATTIGALTDYKQREWTALKQFLDRGRRNEAMTTELELTKRAVSHVYQNTMPNGYIGLTIMRTAVRKTAGPEGFFLPHFRKPRAGDVMALNGGVEGSLANAVAYWGASQGLYEMDTEGQDMINTAYSDAYGQAILGAGRAALINEEAITGVEFNMRDQLFNLRVGGVNSTVSLVPTEIAKNLYDQIMLNLHKGNGKGAMQQWFQRLINNSNDLSKSWYDRMPHGMRASMSEEFQFGDDKGNPNKRFLGVWNQGGVGAWQGDVGQNISMAPFIIARRQKVANWRDGGFQEDR